MIFIFAPYYIIQDVLFGRGAHVDDHPGNQHFRAMVAARKQEFAQLKT